MKNSEFVYLNVKEINLNDQNPRTIDKNKLEKLIESIRNFPKMLEIRPVVVNKNRICLGGNMRVRAALKLGLKKIPVIIREDLTEDEERQFIIKDNVSFGEWDWSVLKTEWELESLSDWGLDLPKMETVEERYTSKIESPIYEPKGAKPGIKAMIDDSEYKKLVTEIDKMNIDEPEKEFLKKTAARHIVFNYAAIAEYYAHSDKDVQLMMERLALVIIDFKKAIEYGFVKLYDLLDEAAENE